jgi:hypothetical protein
MSWFDVDKKGLAKLLERKSKSFILFELLQNAWDQNVTKIDATLVPTGEGRLYEVQVSDDDPEGFQNLTHAFTLFAESLKKGDPKIRGRFNLGEKLVLACCEKAQVITTSGSVIFNKDGTRINKRKGVSLGSIFKGTIRLTKKEYKEICESVLTLIPPSYCETYFNGNKLINRVEVGHFEENLPTEISDEEGNLKKTSRKTIVNIYKLLPGEIPTIYEMGIPIVETDDTYHIDVQQKIPLNMDRDNITPAYLRTLRTHLLNTTINYLEKEEANKTWVKEAMSDERVKKESVEQVLTLRYGKKRFINDPSDTEANFRATSRGYMIIPPSSLSKAEWKNVKKFDAALPSGQITPSGGVKFSASGTPPISDDKLTEGQKTIKEFTHRYAQKLMGIDIDVKFYRSLQGYSACYGDRVLCFNVKSLGHKWFNSFPDNMEIVINLLIHEFGHEYSGNHLSDKYYKALTNLGAKSTILGLKEPEFFKVS